MFNASRTCSTGKPNDARGVRTLVLIVTLLAITSTSASEPFRIDRARQRAIEFERKGAWLEACRCYDEILRRDRKDLLARDGYQRCLRRLHVAARHGDSLHRQTILRLSQPRALDAYEQVLGIVSAAYPDRERVQLTQLFKQGLEELRLALDEPAFRRLYLSDTRPALIEAFKTRLASWSVRRIHTTNDARDQVLAVLRGASRDGIILKNGLANAIGLEFAAGACNALDDHSSFLSPGHLALIQAAIKGKVVGVGLELGIVAGTLQITRVYPKGPAREADVAEGEKILRIGAEVAENLPAEAAAEKLRGEPGTVVLMELECSGGMRRMVKLVRRAVPVPSVDWRTVVQEDGRPAGLVRIFHFQESTIQEVKDAIAQINKDAGQPIKGLILDLRGNPGGLFKSAVAVAELFLTSGVIVVSRSPFKEYNRSFRVEGVGALQVPLVVLIDNETASAAEVLAGALEGRPVTRLLGQTTFGKGTIQCIIPLDKGPLDRLTGIRLTVAKLFSPTNQPYTGRGVIPHITSELKDDLLLAEAVRHLWELLNTTMPPPAMVKADGMS